MTQPRPTSLSSAVRLPRPFKGNNSSVDVSPDSSNNRQASPRWSKPSNAPVLSPSHHSTRTPPKPRPNQDHTKTQIWQQQGPVRTKPTPEEDQSKTQLRTNQDLTNTKTKIEPKAQLRPNQDQTKIALRPNQDQTKIKPRPTSSSSAVNPPPFKGEISSVDMSPDSSDTRYSFTASAPTRSTASSGSPSAVICSDISQKQRYFKKKKGNQKTRVYNNEVLHAYKYCKDEHRPST